MSKFKVGDRVRVVEMVVFDESRINIGDVGTIYEVGPNGRIRMNFGNVSQTCMDYNTCIEPAPAFTINRGDYIDSREFTREECERFCELAVECGFEVSDKNCGRYTEYGVTEGGLIWACYHPDIVGMNNNITPKFREFLDKEKGMKQFTKSDLKDGNLDGCKIEAVDEEVYQVINGGENLLSLKDVSAPYVRLLDDFIWERAAKVTDRDGTVLFEREEEPRELTLKEIAEQFGVPVERIRIKD